MPYLSALKFLNHAVKPNYLTPFERRLYIQRPEEKNIVSLLKKSYSSFFAVIGPRKSGKSTLLRHLADFPLKNSALYLKFEQKLLQPEELHRTIAKTVGYHNFHEESLLSSIFCFWRMFQENTIDRHSLALYLEKVGNIYKKLTKGKLPVMILDGAGSLGKKGSFVLDDMAYLAKSLADSRSMVTIFGVLEGANPHMLNSRGYNISKQRIYLSYMTHQEVLQYTHKAVNGELKDEIVKMVDKENKRIYGGNLKYANLLIDHLQNAKSIKEIKEEARLVEEIITVEVGEELRKSFLTSGLESDGKLSMYKAFEELNKEGRLSLDKYLSLFNKKDQPAAINFLNQQMLLREERDEIIFQGQAVKHYIENHILNNYQIPTNTDIDEYTALIEATIVKPEHNTKWSDLVGLENVKQKMLETIILPTLNPLLFTGLRSPVHGILFYGPPGNGKTMIAKVLANECKRGTFFNLSSSTFSLSGEMKPEKLVKALFSIARKRQPAIIFIDEIDSILSKGMVDCTNLKEEFKAQLEALSSEDQVVVVGATNRPFDIETGIMKKFPIRLYLELPCDKARLNLLKKMAKSINSSLNNSDLEELVKKTKNYSFADLSALFREASYQPIREIPNEEVAMVNVDDIRPVILKDFEEAFKRVSRSVPNETLNRLSNWSFTGI